MGKEFAWAAPLTRASCLDRELPTWSDATLKIAAAANQLCKGKGDESLESVPLQAHNDCAKGL